MVFAQLRAHQTFRVVVRTPLEIDLLRILRVRLDGAVRALEADAPARVLEALAAQHVPARQYHGRVVVRRLLLANGAHEY